MKKLMWYQRTAFLISILSACTSATFSGGGSPGQSSDGQTPGNTPPPPEASPDGSKQDNVVPAPPGVDGAPPTVGPGPNTGPGPNADPGPDVGPGPTNPDGSSPPPPPSVPPSSPGGTPAPDQCRPDQLKIGTQMVFVIDNSNSNAATDCPQGQKIGSFGGADLYECAEETSREKAVLSAFDQLLSVASSQPSNALATSSVAITSFPTRDAYVDGSKQESPFVAVKGESRGTLVNALKFARRPFGLTPYVAAMDSAETVMKTAVNDQRSKVVVFVTDGEPTDRSPEGAATKAQALTGRGIQVISVFYSNTGTAASRREAHTSMMRRIESEYLSRPEGHWYDASRFQSFESYVTYLLGDATTPSLLTRMTSKVAPTCVDRPGSLCARMSYSVTNATGLKQVFTDIIKTQAIGCGL